MKFIIVLFVAVISVCALPWANGQGLFGMFGPPISNQPYPRPNPGPLFSNQQPAPGLPDFNSLLTLPQTIFEHANDLFNGIFIQVGEIGKVFTEIQASLPNLQAALAQQNATAGTNAENGTGGVTVPPVVSPVN